MLTVTGGYVENRFSHEPAAATSRKYKNIFLLLLLLDIMINKVTCYVVDNQ